MFIFMFTVMTVKSLVAEKLEATQSNIHAYVYMTSLVVGVCKVKYNICQQYQSAEPVTGQ